MRKKSIILKLSKPGSGDEKTIELGYWTGRFTKTNGLKIPEVVDSMDDPKVKVFWYRWTALRGFTRAAKNFRKHGVNGCTMIYKGVERS